MDIEDEAKPEAEAKDNYDNNSVIGARESKPEQDICSQLLQKLKLLCQDASDAVSDTSQFKDLSSYDKQLYAAIVVISEILDGEHDLSRTPDENNPLYDYIITLGAIGGSNPYLLTLINLLTKFKVCFDKSQTAIKYTMKKILAEYCHKVSYFPSLKLIPLIDETFEQKPTGSLEELQNTLGGDPYFVKNALVETHRGGSPRPQNAASKAPDNSYTDFWKSQLTTTFDNNCKENSGFLSLTIDMLFPSVSNDKQFVKDRLYDNFFPQSFSIFLKGIDEIRHLQTNCESILSEVQEQIIAITNTRIDVLDLHGICVKLRSFLDLVVGKINNTTQIVLLHMFTAFLDNDEKKPIFSLQYDQVTADQVTVELFGYAKRSPDSTPPSLDTRVFFDNDDYYSRNPLIKQVVKCHALYAKTCGDGATIFSAKVFKQKGIHGSLDDIVPVITSDAFCMYRSLFVVRQSFRQAPSKKNGEGGDRIIQLVRNVNYNLGKNVQAIDVCFGGFCKNFANIISSNIDCIEEIKQAIRNYVESNNFHNEYNMLLNTKTSGLIEEQTVRNPCMDLNTKTMIFKSFIEKKRQLKVSELDSGNNPLLTEFCKFIDLLRKVNLNEHVKEDEKNNLCAYIRTFCDYDYSKLFQINIVNELKEFEQRLSNFCEKISNFTPRLRQSIRNNSTSTTYMSIDDFLRQIATYSNLLNEAGFNKKDSRLFASAVVKNKLLNGDKINNAFQKYFTDIVGSIKELIESINLPTQDKQELIDYDLRNLNEENCKELYRTVVDIYNKFVTYNKSGIQNDEGDQYKMKEKLKQQIFFLGILFRALPGFNPEDVDVPTPMATPAPSIRIPTSFSRGNTVSRASVSQPQSLVAQRGTVRNIDLYQKLAQKISINHENNSSPASSVSNPAKKLEINTPPLSTTSDIANSPKGSPSSPSSTVLDDNQSIESRSRTPDQSSHALPASDTQPVATQLFDLEEPFRIRTPEGTRTPEPHVIQETLARQDTLLTQLSNQLQRQNVNPVLVGHIAQYIASLQSHDQEDEGEIYNFIDDENDYENECDNSELAAEGEAGSDAARASSDNMELVTTEGVVQNQEPAVVQNQESAVVQNQEPAVVQNQESAVVEQQISPPKKRNRLQVFSDYFFRKRKSGGGTRRKPKQKRHQYTKKYSKKNKLRKTNKNKRKKQHRRTIKK